MSDAVRRILLAILLLGVAGIFAELLLLGHDEDAYQWIPIALAGATVLMSAVVVLRPRAGTVRLFQLLMLLLIASGAVGMYRDDATGADWASLYVQAPCSRNSGDDISLAVRRHSIGQQARRPAGSQDVKYQWPRPSGRQRSPASSW